MKYEARINGKKSVGYAYKKQNPNAIIYAFRSWGEKFWCGNLEDMRKTKAEAYNDCKGD